MNYTYTFHEESFPFKMIENQNNISIELIEQTLKSQLNHRPKSKDLWVTVCEGRQEVMRFKLEDGKLFSKTIHQSDWCMVEKPSHEVFTLKYNDGTKKRVKVLTRPSNGMGYIRLENLDTHEMFVMSIRTFNKVVCWTTY